MLLEFRVENFKSFKEKLEFKMIPTQIQDLKYSLIKRKAGSEEYKGLSSAVIYGPNAAGKTNIIGAMEVLKKILLRGNIKNSKEGIQNNVAAHRLELIPNIKSESEKPVNFYIKFIAEGLLFEYELAVKLGAFMEEDYERKVEFEELKVNDNIVFSRKLNKELEIGNMNKIKKYLISNFNEETSVKLIRNNLIDNELFLNTYFNLIFSSKIVSIIKKWLEEKLVIIYSANNMVSKPDMRFNEEGKVFVDKKLNEALKAFGLCGKEIAFSKNGEDKEPEAVSILEREGKGVAIIPAEIFESYGTMRFLSIYPLVREAISYGKTIVIDEFDASIHPVALMSIIKVFHNDNINKKGAQLIFNTHNPIFLNSRIFRRDEIKFVERDEESGNSDQYALSDFKTSGPNSVRNHEKYMENYFSNKYGAIEDIDFMETFVIESGDGVKDAEDN